MEWKEYLGAFFHEYRKLFSSLDEETQSTLLEFNTARALTSPCQVEVIETKKPKILVWIVTNDKKRPDMEFLVNRDVEDPKSFIENRQKRKPQWSKEFCTNIKKYLLLDKDSRITEAPDWHESRWYPIRNLYMLLFNHDFWTDKDTQDHEVFAKKELHDFMWIANRLVQQEKIEKTTTAIKKEALEIPQKERRSKILEATKRIDEALIQLKRLDTYEKKILTIETEIKGVRKMIGTTKEFQDFRVFATDVEELKKSHTHKDIFIAEIKRLDEKIDNTLDILKTKIDALNIRIEDLKAIKFWSKRTLLEIALAILATIATLFATGILEF